jgi:predicted RNA-binding Zn ribbon-like protein
VNSDLVIDFVNTHRLRSGHEELESPAQLRTWLIEQGLLAPGAKVSQDDLAWATRVREAIRDLIDGRCERDASAALERASREARLGIRFGLQEAQLEPAAGGVAGAIGRILLEIAIGMSDGTWERVKVCEADDCRTAFFDGTKNGSRAWCSMQSCGNRAKVRAYRKRHAAA